MKRLPGKSGLAAATLTLVFAAACMASEIKVFRLGYIAEPENALCVVGAEQGFYRQAVLGVELIRFSDPSDVLEALEEGKIEAGALPAADALKAIARGGNVRIIAGGGTKLRNTSAPGESGERESGTVVLISGRLATPRDKRMVTRLTAALIRAYQSLAHQPGESWRLVRRATGTKLGNQDFVYDPNPDYWRLERLWHRLGLADPTKPGDLLANHVYEEIYCDALDQILADGDLNDPVIKKLFERAVCVPNCCPANGRKVEG